MSLVVAAACTVSPPTAGVTAFTNEQALIATLHNAWAIGDWPAWRSVFADDASIEFNATGSMNRFEAADLQRRLRQPLRSLTLPAPDKIQASTDTQGRRWLHYRTEWAFGFDGSAGPVRVPASVSCRIRGGRIAEYRMDWDTLPYVAAAAGAAGVTDAILDMLMSAETAEDDGSN